MPQELDAKGRPRVDIVGLMQLCRALAAAYEDARWYVERVGGMAGQGGAPSFEFGFATGALAAAIVAATGQKPGKVEPLAWKGAFRLIGKPKRASIEAAKIARPGVAHLLLIKRRGLTQAQATGRADAILMGEYVSEIARHEPRADPRPNRRRRVVGGAISRHAGG